MSRAEFSVYQWFPDGSYERYLEYVDIDRAMRGFKFLSTNVAARMGVTQRVMMTDGNDFCVAEWRQGLGLIWPIPSDEWFGGWSEFK